MKKVFEIIIDDGINCFKLHIPAENKKDALSYVEGNGEIIRCKLSTERTMENPIAMDIIAKALRQAQFGQMEIDLITRALSDCEFIA